MSSFRIILSPERRKRVRLFTAFHYAIEYAHWAAAKEGE